MAYIFIREYDLDLLELNKEMYHMYIESHKGVGGDRRTVSLRQHERGLPLTLRENFTKDGVISSDTEKRDITTIKNEIQNISRLANAGVNVCIPLNSLINECCLIEARSPKVSVYVMKRLESAGMRL